MNRSQLGWERGKGVSGLCTSMRESLDGRPWCLQQIIKSSVVLLYKVCWGGLCGYKVRQTMKSLTFKYLKELGFGHLQ